MMIDKIENKELRGDIHRMNDRSEKQIQHEMPKLCTAMLFLKKEI
jgi:hypothetical protein